MKKKFKLRGTSMSLKVAEQNFNSNLKSREFDESFQEMLRRRDASKKYAEEAQIHFKPKMRSKADSTKSYQTLPKINKKNIPGYILKK